MTEQTASIKFGRLIQSLCFIVIASIITLAVLTYNTADPSFNYSAQSQPQNLFGSSGAYLSDFLLQSVGMATVILCITPFILGLRLLFKRPVRFVWLRLSFCTIIALLSSSILLSYIPSSEHWLFIGYGGYVGELFKSNLLVDLPTSLVIFVALITSFFAFLFAVSVSFAELKTSYYYVSHVVRYVLSSIMFAVQSIQYVYQMFSPSQSDDPVAPPKKRVKTERKAPKPKETKSKTKLKKKKQTSLVLSHDDLELPDIELLSHVSSKAKRTISESSLENNARLLEKVLDDYGVKGNITDVFPGPVVTLYELEPEAGTKTSKVVALAYDIARSMSAKSARISVTPGRSAIGIELPNTHRETVYLRELLEEKEFLNKSLSLPIALGKDISGNAVFVDMAKMPHVLVAGTTGSGKSVAVNSMIISLLYALGPSECKFIMIDPKMLELSVYNGIPHLLTPVVTEPGKAVVALKWVVKEMEERYRLMSHLGVRNISGFNKRIEDAIANGEVIEREVRTGFNPETGEAIIENKAIDLKKLPFIVVVVDEMADLMLVAGKEIEGLIQRLAQMARAAGIHIILATQRPSVDVITGVIKANLPTRISFQVTSKIDSRTILGEMGAEQLLGMGDMLYMYGGARTQRVHGPFVSDKEVEKVVSFLKKQSEPDYEEAVLDESEADDVIIPGVNVGAGAGSGSASSGEDELYDRAVMVVIKNKRASTSFVQRQLRIGYNKAANLIERMEEEGVISAPNHAGKREILAPSGEE
ncbi:MAG: DNA translocase FtsK 4TM domain-containing protein [Rickettsiales bacterium]|nr:DNA translocase FtsK 4TM domain-containing protein [Rickettsiales bacterium]